jgi:hypothetical protein
LKQKPTINYFTYVNREYYPFVLPFIFSIIKNTNHFVEVVVENRKEFFDLYGKKLSNLIYILNDKSFFRSIISDIKYYNENLNQIIPNTKRFLIEPLSIRTDYTYIIDCDMLIKPDDDIIKHNINSMKKNKSCFFNIKRENREVLSGIHFVENKTYYPKLNDFMKMIHTDDKDFAENINKHGDEGFLYQFVSGAIGDPEKLTKDNERKLPGDHISPNRNKKYTHIKDELCKDDQWKEAFKQFDPKFVELMS